MTLFHRFWSIVLFIAGFAALAAGSAPSISASRQQAALPAPRQLGGSAPPSCVSNARSFQSAPSRPIPPIVSVISDTITVAGANPVLFDLDVSTVISHTNATHLDITLTSPAGTVVTLSSDNGDITNNDNLFAGTVWDDSANPAGQAPYASNNGLATDHGYVNNVPATPLAPEEPLAAFAGENPNGVWILTISDDTTGDGGTLARWGLTVTALTSAPGVAASVQAANSQSQAISSGAPSVINSTITLTPSGFITRVSLTTAISHTYAADLDVTLRAPSGKSVTLTTDNGFGSDGVFLGTRWDIDANPGGQVPYASNNGLASDHNYVNNVVASPLAPEESLALFWGDSPAGQWTLTISDDAADDGGRLEGWTLSVSTGACGLPTPTPTFTPTTMPTFTPTPEETFTPTPTNTPGPGECGLSQGFADLAVLPAAGWSLQNLSQPLGPTGWFQGDPKSFPAQAGPASAYIAANFNNAAGTGTIDNWLLTPVQRLANGSALTFWTRVPDNQEPPDRLELRMSVAGASTNTADFTTLLLTINPQLQTGVYPEVWTQLTATVSGLPAPTNGRFAFRYYVTNGGQTGANSNYIGIDTVNFCPAGGSTPTNTPTSTPTNTPTATVTPTASPTGTPTTLTRKLYLPLVRK